MEVERARERWSQRVALLRWWWAFWLVAQSFLVTDELSSDPITRELFALAFFGTLLVAVVLVLLIVRRVTVGQENKHQDLPRNPP